MTKGFWQQLNKPFTVLAPMYDVTDTAFRQIVIAAGRPDIFFTEFVSVDGLAHPASQEKLIKHYLQFTPAEHPIVMQVFGSDPENFRAAGELAVRLGFDGLDINMGCPDKKVMKNRAGGAMCLEPENAIEVVRAAAEGAAGLPVSVKTRLGYDRDIIDEWLPQLLKAEPVAVTIHARTARQMSRVPADWEALGRAANIARGSGTLIVGNGDVKTLSEAREKAARYGVDGVMIGRGIFDNLWVFDPAKDPAAVTVEERLAVMVEHARLFEKHFAGIKNFHMMYKHLHHYAFGFPGAKELRQRLMSTRGAQEVAEVTAEFLKEMARSER